MNFEELKDFLDAKVEQYETPDFIEEDPISIPHRYKNSEDIEIAGILTAMISWGNRKAILKSANQMMLALDDAPSDFVRNANQSELDRLGKFYYRTFNGVDMQGMVAGLRHIYLKDGGLKKLFALSGDETVRESIARFRAAMVPNIETRTYKHIADVNRGAAAKRINMFLRWMARPSNRGVDFGIWSDIIPASKLLLPLDVHTGNVGRAIGILNRKQNDWKAVDEITSALRKMDADDPVKYDFALFGLGIYEHFK